MQKTFFGTNLTNKNKLWLIVSLLTLGILSRIIPHLPNSTAMLFSILTLGFVLPRSFALLLTLVIALSSDFLISLVYGYPFLGYWSLFTYSGFLGIAVIGSLLNKITFKNSILFLLSSSFLFWVWTNFGVWLVSGMYSKTIAGFIVCYIAALPFLSNQFIGDIFCLLALGLISLKLSTQKIALKLHT